MGLCVQAWPEVYIRRCLRMKLMEGTMKNRVILIIDLPHGGVLQRADHASRSAMTPCPRAHVPV
jgi:hypothetical protein